MDKLKMMSMDRTSENIEKIRAIFPNCVTEVLRDGKEEYAIDFDMLRQELSKDIVEGREERYQMTWPDKKKAIWLANSQIDKTLRPCREESVDFDNTENLYIEGRQPRGAETLARDISRQSQNDIHRPALQYGQR